MKRVLVTVMAMMLTLVAQAQTNPTDAYKGRWRDAGAEMKILPQYLDEEDEYGDLAVYPIDFYAVDDGGQPVIWTMTARYNPGKDRMEYADGAKIEGGDIVLSGTRGYLKLDGAGKLVWMDSDDAGAAMHSFTRALSDPPGAEDFADGYFRVVAGLERGGNARLNAARTIVEVLKFAESRDLWNADGEVMQRNLEAAWNSLSDGERARFDAVFDDGVSDPADAAFDDYPSLRRAFENAGVGAEMARLTGSLEVRLSWEFLSSATLNMGNLDDGEYEGAEG